MPVATIVTDAFAPVAQGHARALGLQDLPIVTTPHPMESLSKPQIEGRASKIVEEIVHVLTVPAEEIAGEYRGKYARQELVRSSTPA